MSKALPGKISKGSGKFAQKLVITIPPDLQQPAPWPVRSAERPQEHAVTTRRASTALISSVGCKNKKHTFGAKITFAPNPAPPPKPSGVGHLDGDVQEVVGLDNS